jgi:hypothetical protein
VQERALRQIVYEREVCSIFNGEMRAKRQWEADLKTRVDLRIFWSLRIELGGSLSKQPITAQFPRAVRLWSSNATPNFPKQLHF